MSFALINTDNAKPLADVGPLAIDFSRFASLKGEFEAEGLNRVEMAAEAIWAARRDLDYLVKIGGCEAKSDVDYLQKLGIRSLVAPMIESPFAMSKYMDMLADGVFDHVGVTIETFYAVERIDEILDAGTKLTNVTIGRSDLTASFGGSSTNCTETLDKTLRVARAAKARGLEVTMGGSVDATTRKIMREGHELATLLDAVETRKIVMRMDQFMLDGTFEDSIKAECELLEIRMRPMQTSLAAMSKRHSSIRSRL